MTNHAFNKFLEYNFPRRDEGFENGIQIGYFDVKVCFRSSQAEISGTPQTHWKRFLDSLKQQQISNLMKKFHRLKFLCLI